MAQKKKIKSKESSWLIVLLIIGIFAYNKYCDLNGINQVSNEYLSNNNINENDDTNISKKLEVSSDLKVYFFDVGQADSILVANDGHYMLIDAGNNKDGKLIVNELKDMGITKLDYLVGTHPHEDHIGGLDDVIDNLDIDVLYMPKRQADNKTFEDVLDSISAKNLKITTPKVGDNFYVGEAKCKVISVESDAEDTNNSSIVIELTFGNKKYLFTGDAEKDIENKYTWEDIDVLKVGHHGSRYSSTANFLDSTKPEIAIISVGNGNDYGHPHDESIKRLKKANAEIYRTDEKGTILLKSDGNNIDVEFLNICLDGN